MRALERLLRQVPDKGVTTALEAMIVNLDKSDLSERAGTVDGLKMEHVKAGLRRALGL